MLLVDNVTEVALDLPAQGLETKAQGSHQSRDAQKINIAFLREGLSKDVNDWYVRCAVHV